MAAFVVDVSACMPWCCPDEATAESAKLLQRAESGDILHVPSLWPWEITNTVAVVVRRKRISADDGSSFLGLLSGFNFAIAQSPEILDLPRIHELASRHQLTAYDTAYLDLAIRLALPLATLDVDLREAALAEGLSVL